MQPLDDGVDLICGSFPDTLWISRVLYEANEE